MILLRSYATLSEFFNDIFGTHWNLPFNSFGFFVALAFFGAAIVLVKELKRKEKEKIFLPQKEIIITGAPASRTELVLNFALGFVLGWKIIGIFVDYQGFIKDTQSYIASWQGNVPGGIILGGIFAWMRWREKNKQKTDPPKKETIDVYPHQRIGDIVTIAAIFGILGAKIFSNFEEPGGWKSFFADPVGGFFSGLTIYGGLILGAAAVIWYAVRKKISVLHLGDAVAPALILAYGIGRIGCQVAGDGDWGILNSAYISKSESESVPTDPLTYQQTVTRFNEYYRAEFQNRDSIIPAKSFKAPSFLPTWAVAENYAYNVNSDGVPVEGHATDKWHSYLPVPVFPTPLYEIIMSLIIFFILWGVRKKIKIPGMILAFYVFLAGLERYFIEKIRVNNYRTFLGIRATQAEFISVGFMIFGILFMLYLYQRSRKTNAIS